MFLCILLGMPYRGEAGNAREHLGLLVPLRGSPKPLPVRGLSVRVHVSSTLARVEIDQVFFNPYRTLEAAYMLAIPPSGRITRLTMNVGKKMMEGEIAAKVHARTAYETIVRKRLDPALTECMGGTLFRTRVFPVFARQEKRVLLEYTLPLAPGQKSLRIDGPHAGADLKLPWLEIKVFAQDPVQGLGLAAQFKGRREKPLALKNGTFVGYGIQSPESIRVSWKATDVEAQVVPGPQLPDGRHPFLLTVPNDLKALKDGKARDFLILLDTSADGGNNRLNISLKALRSLLKGLKSEDRFGLYAFDLKPVPFRNADWICPDASKTTQAVNWLKKRGSGGATHFGRALEAALGKVKSQTSKRPLEVVVLSDGKNTMDGSPHFEKVLSALRAFPNLRVHCLGIGKTHNSQFLCRIASMGRGKFISFQGEDNAHLREAFTCADPHVEVDSFKADLIPLASNLASDGGMLFAGVSDTQIPPKVWIRVKIRDKLCLYGVPVQARSESSALLCGFALMNHFEEKRTKKQGELLLDLSRNYGVMCCMTSYIVLETDRDYRKWGIERIQAARRDPPLSLPKTHPYIRNIRRNKPVESAGKLLDDLQKTAKDRSQFRDPSVTPAILQALDWLARHQNSDGSWSCTGFSKHCQDAGCKGDGSTAEYDIGLTGLALLAFLNAWGNQYHGPPTPILLGLAFLRSKQDTEGCIGRRGGNGHWIYGHAICTLALARARQIFPKENLEAPLEKAADFLVDCQNPYLGWRYGKFGEDPQDNDTSVTGWAADALFEARRAGAAVGDQVFQGALNWLDKVTDYTYYKTGYTTKGDSGARLSGTRNIPIKHFQSPGFLFFRGPRGKRARMISSYQPSEAMTAIAVNLRIRSGMSLKTPSILGGVNLFRHSPPCWDLKSGLIDMYYWYWGTVALARFGGTTFLKWWSPLKEALLPNQQRFGCLSGSWDPIGAWGSAGGRVYSTAICCLALEAPWLIRPGKQTSQEIQRFPPFEKPGASGLSWISTKNWEQGIELLFLTHSYLPVKGAFIKNSIKAFSKRPRELTDFLSVLKKTELDEPWKFGIRAEFFFHAYCTKWAIEDLKKAENPPDLSAEFSLIAASLCRWDDLKAMLETPFGSKLSGDFHFIMQLLKWIRFPGMHAKAWPLGWWESVVRHFPQRQFFHDAFCLILFEQKRWKALAHEIRRFEPLSWTDEDRALHWRALSKGDGESEARRFASEEFEFSHSLGHPKTPSDLEQVVKKYRLIAVKWG
jgi:Mg-chelatase subunit ChlD